MRKDDIERRERLRREERIIACIFYTSTIGSLAVLTGIAYAIYCLVT